jgi:hypothetical protein
MEGIEPVRTYPITPPREVKRESAPAELVVNVSEGCRVGRKPSVEQFTILFN